MGRYQENSKMNENSAEQTLLDNIFNFYVDKFSKSSIREVEEHFLVAVNTLVDRGEIDQSSLDDFLEENGIDKITKTTKKSTYNNTYNDGGCGYTSRGRSSC